MTNKDKKSSIWSMFNLLELHRHKLDISGHPSEHKLTLALNELLNLELFNIAELVSRLTDISFIDSLHSTSVLFSLYLCIPSNLSNAKKTLIFYKQILLYARSCIRFCADMQTCSDLIGSNNSLETKKLLFYAYPSHAFNSAGNIGNSSISYYIDDYIRAHNMRSNAYSFRSYVRPSARKDKDSNLPAIKTLPDVKSESLFSSLVSRLESKLNLKAQICELCNLVVEAFCFWYLFLKAIFCNQDVAIAFIAFINCRCSKAAHLLIKRNIALHILIHKFHFSPALEDSRKLGDNFYQHVYSTNINEPPSSTFYLSQPTNIKDLLPYLNPSSFSISLLAYSCSASSYFRAALFKMLYSSNSSEKILNKIVPPEPRLMKTRSDQADILLHNCLLGFETTILNPSSLIKPTKTKKYILVYDVPPDSISKQLQYSILGSPMSSLENVTAFHQDISNVCYSLNITILLKPKYSLSNYMPAYLELINSISAVNENFYVLNPYARIIEADLSSFLGVIAMPFTSILKFSRAVRPVHHYYAPNCCGKIFADNPFQNDYPLLVGRHLLKTTLLASL